jgi:hypothetical protein
MRVRLDGAMGPAGDYRRFLDAWSLEVRKSMVKK